MKAPTKSSPIVIRLKKWKLIVNRTTPSTGEKRGPKKKGPEPFHKGSREEGPPAIRREVEPDNHRSAWISAFGSWLRIDEQKGFYLDGRPISLDDLMIATNRLRKDAGLNPIGRNPRWFV